MAGIPTAGATGASMGGGLSWTQATTNMANIVSANTASLSAGNKINASRGSAVALAGSSQALANQTGGNIMGFTYE